MKVTYLRLENVAGLVAGSNKQLLEIDFTKSKHQIVTIIGRNGDGKSVLMSSISPFAGVTSIDERSTLSYILPHKNGYKEIHYQDGMNTYIIKHYFKASKESHTVKSYFMMNGEELNENGNVRSFLSLVEIHLGLTPDMMRLIRLGSNVSSIISLTPASRKEYIGKLIDEIDAYLKIYKDINDEIKVVKAMISTNTANLYNCHISDPVVEQEKIDKIAAEIKQYERDRDAFVSKLATVNQMMAANDIGDLRKKKQEAESSLREFGKVESEITEQGLGNISIDQLTSKRANIMAEKIDVQSKINSYRISIDSSNKNIERLETAIHRITSDSDIESLMSMIKSLRESIDSASDIIKGFMIPDGMSSDILYQMINKLSTFNTIAQTIYSFGTKPVAIYLKLRKDGNNIDKWLKNQSVKIQNGISGGDLETMMKRLFQEDGILSPNCDTEFDGCPYYRFAEAIDRMWNESQSETYDSETLRYIQVISRNMDSILNEADRMVVTRIPDMLKEHLREHSIMERLGSKLPLFNVSDFQEYLTILRESELYQSNRTKLEQYEYQLMIYRKSGIDGQLAQIADIKKNIEFYRNNIRVLEDKIADINRRLQDTDKQITLVSRYNDSKKYKKLFEATLESTNKLLGPLENAAAEKMELEFSINQYGNLIARSRDEHKSLENKLNEYNRLVKEGEELSLKFKELNIILKAVSTKKGIPIIYMKRYLGKIKNFANQLLALIYGDAFKLAKFNVTEELFEIPYIKNGNKVSDVKYASQSEFAMSTMALSFALSNRATEKYNILLLDEIDGGLDEDSRYAFLKMLYTQMNALHSEQLFIISQNLNQMANVPMDCIILNDTGHRTKLQNVIYE